MSGRHGRGLVTAGLVAGGVVVGHALAYALAYPVQAVRSARLDETGHEGFSLLVLLGVLAAGTAILVIGLRSARRVTSPPTVGLLLRLQVSAFAMLELAERGFDLGAFVHDPAVIVGLVVQAVLAFVIVALARGAARAGRWFARPARVSPRGAARTTEPRTAEPVPPDPHAIGLRRAPPCLALA